MITSQTVATTVDDPTTASLVGWCREVLRADLVGIADIDRCRHAPPRMSPQGILPTARSVVVMAVHHPDACIELGGREHPQEIGPYRVQYRMNQRLDEMSFRLANRLEAAGHRAVPIFSSNSWRYRGYKEAREQFAPDVSHMHMACAAGLAEFGYSGLAITPEFGARNRFVTVITDAELAPTPLLEPGSVCDNCMLCRQHCPSQALSKELDGWNEVPIGDKVYRYANKNLWRCSWGEHFDLDLDLELPDVVTPEVIEQALEEHGQRGGEMGCCLRFCLPRSRRRFDRDYSAAPRRRRDTVAGPGGAGRDVGQRLAALAAARGADGIVVSAIAGNEFDRFLPGAVRAVTIALRRPRAAIDRGAETAERILAQSAYDITRHLEERGWDAICETDHDEGWFTALLGDEERVVTTTVLTTCPLAETGSRLAPPRPTVPCTATALAACADATCERLVHGVAEARVLEAVAADLAPHWADESELVAEDRGGWENRFNPMDPVVHEQPVTLSGPCTRLPGARSVLVLGLPLPGEAVACAGRPPAEAPGPLALAQYESRVLLRLAAWRVARELEAHGYQALVTDDLLGTGSLTGNPRGPQPDAFCNRFAAVAAGLGRLGRCGHLVHPEHGAELRTISIVTDAPLPADGPLADDHRPPCEGCTTCTDACPVKAFVGPVTVAIDGVDETFERIDRRRCDWAKRYSLVAREGTELLGWDLDLEPPPRIGADDLAAALRELPGIERHRPCNHETCVLACPHGVCGARS